jgi:DNA-binding MarR family transcriptional regulator
MATKPKPDPPAQVGPNEFRIGFYVHDVSRMRRTLFDQELKPLGITRSQWWALAQLSRGDAREGGEGMLQTELARMLDVGKVTIGGLVDRLESSGFVRRKPDRDDRRAKRVLITKQGHAVLDQMIAVARHLNVDILRGISDRDVAIAERVLSTMKGNIRERLAQTRDGDEDNDDLD